jgi:hypothetical protein
MTMVNIDSKAFLSLLKLPDMPACDEGMELAKQFLEACGYAVANVDAEDSTDLTVRFVQCWNAFLKHRNDCPKCNEV